MTAFLLEAILYIIKSKLLSFGETLHHRFHLNVTVVCNLACAHCYQENHTGKPVPMPQIEEILRKLQAFRAYRGEGGRGYLTLSGGEPATRRDLPDIIRLAIKYGFMSRIVTNATMIDMKLAKELRNAGLRLAQVSLDGAAKETHETIRGKNSWDRTMNGIEALCRAGIFVVLSMALIPGRNMHEAPLMLDLSRRLKVWAVKYQRLIPRGSAPLNLDTQGEFHRTFVCIIERAVEIKYRRFIMLFDPLAHNLPNLYPGLCKRLYLLITDMCRCDRTRLMEVDYNGDIYYCRVGMALGNIWTDDLAVVWEHPLLRNIRVKTSRGACSCCAVWNRCGGGCPAVTYGLHKDISAPDYACPSWTQRSERDERKNGERES
ncbi:MAG: radical SAM protein [Nitrospirae bacterium]|nr:radical SAM protein [Nitrospirota bacterium]